MARPDKYTQEQIEAEIQDFALWTIDGNSIVREIVAPNFVAAVGIVNSVAIIAESMDHHPDILIYGWNKIRIKTSTHDRGGLTELDFKLAQKIDELNV